MIDFNLKKESIWEFLVLGLIIIAGVAGFLVLSPPEQKELSSIDTSDWKTYRNQEFHFQIKYPSDWQLAEFPGDSISPKFNIFKESEGQSPPFDHFSTTTNVSVFPHGIPTEGVLGSRKESNVQVSESVEEAQDYILESGDRWATYVSLQNPPWSWNESGFLWARVGVDGHSVECREDGEIIPMSECQPLGQDHRIVHYGSINPKQREIEKLILSSFEFLEPENSNLIQLESPKPYEKIRSPLLIEGQARGNWFFEASFPLRLMDERGEVVAEGFAQAQGEWMTEDFVDFEAEISFGPLSTDQGTLVLEKANPSGLPENQNSISIPILFDWLEYRSQDLDFSVKHPRSWKVKEGRASNSVDFGEEKTYNIDSQTQKVFNAGFTVVRYQGEEELPGNEEEQLSLQDWISQEYAPLQEEETIQSTTFGAGDYSGTLVRTFKPLGVTALVTRIFVRHKKSVYQIRSRVPSPVTVNFPTDFDYRTVFNQMISSFNFLD